jgi:hypothetical protein
MIPGGRAESTRSCFELFTGCSHVALAGKLKAQNSKLKKISNLQSPKSRGATAWSLDIYR